MKKMRSSSTETSRIVPSRPSAFGLAIGCTIGLLVLCESAVLIFVGADAGYMRLALVPALLPWFIVAYVKLKALKRVLVWELEEATHIDIDRDGQIGGHGHHFVYVGNAAEKRQSMLLDDMKVFIRGCYEHGVTWASWKGRNLPSGRIGQQAWHDHCDSLARAGIGHFDKRGTLILDLEMEEALAAYSA